VPVGQIELGFHIAMAGETEPGILFFEKFFRDPGSVNPVTVTAPHGGQFVDTSFKLKKLLVAAMAFQACVRTVLCVLILKGKDKSLPHCLGVFRPRAVAGFTSFLALRDFRVSQALPVGVTLFKSFVEFLMTSLTGIGPHILFSFAPLLAQGGNTDKGQQQQEGKKRDSQTPTRFHKGSPSIPAEKAP